MRLRLPRATHWGALLAIAAAVFVPVAVAGSASDVDGALASPAQNLWFVELSGAPTAGGGSLSTLKSEKQAFRDAAKKAGITYTERYAFNVLWNGFSIKADPSQLSAIASLSNVKAISPVESIPIPETQPTSEPDLVTAITMTGADIAQSELGLTGAGVKVGVIDTGIDLDHPDLGGDGDPGAPHPIPNSRVSTGYDFVGDAFTGSNTPVPDDNPDDCNGHGTHVAGIVGANGAVTGVAPGVTFGAYRVFGCSGSTPDDIVILALERALADGMDVVNMSLGSAFDSWPESPAAEASDLLVNKGVVVVASIGNSGASGVYSAGAPGVGDKVIGVASFDNTHQNLSAFTISPDDHAVGYVTAGGAPPAPVSGTYPLARTGTKTTTNDACSALPAGSLAGDVALIRRGTCSFYIKATNAMNAGAAGVVLYNNVAGILNPTVAGTPPVTIPVVGVSKDDGELIDDRLAAGSVDLTWTTQTISIPQATGGTISSFSSYGLNAELGLKPDIGAPGGSIRSTYPIELGSYANLSGTSMASPHVAGAAALYLQAHPNTSAQAIRSIFQNSADPAKKFGSNDLDPVHRQGAGLIDVDDAILATTKITPGKLALGESQAGPQTRTLTLTNSSAAAVTYDLGYVNALSTAGSTYSPTFPTSDATVTFSSPSVIVPAGGSATVDATVTAATAPDKAQYGGYILFTPQGGGQLYRVPFAGFVGDYQSIQVLTPTAFGFPWLAQAVGSNLFNRPNGATYTMTSGDIPYIVVHLNHQARRLRMEIFTIGGKSWHRAADLEYLARHGAEGPNSANISFFSALPFDGTTSAAGKTYTVPNGTYVIKVSVLKALGDPNDPAHWETWTSPVVTIARP
jgi:minor extracellular serine protease Vpr